MKHSVYFRYFHFCFSLKKFFRRQANPNMQTCMFRNLTCCYHVFSNIHFHFCSFLFIFICVESHCLVPNSSVHARMWRSQCHCCDGHLIYFHVSEVEWSRSHTVLKFQENLFFPTVRISLWRFGRLHVVFLCYFKCLWKKKFQFNSKNFTGMRPIFVRPTLAMVNSLLLAFSHEDFETLGTCEIKYWKYYSGLTHLAAPYLQQDISAA